MNRETEGDERQKEGIVKGPEKEIRKSPEEKGLDHLESDIAKEGGNLEKKGTFFQDIPKWAKVLTLQFLKLAKVGLVIGGTIGMNQAVAGGGNAIVAIASGFLILGAAAGAVYLEKIIKKSMEKKEEGREDGPGN